MFHVRATRHFDWLIERTGSILTHDARGIECVDEQGRTLGMVVYDQWTPNACTAHLALHFPGAWRRLAYPAFAYPFVEADRKIMLVSISSQNHRSLRLVRKLGFREIVRMRDIIEDGIDTIVFEMRREHCRWLKR